jgi:putative ABC transport system permease protein
VIRRDILVGFRSLARAAKLAVAVVACVALSVGGAATVSTFLWAILFRPLPFPDAGRLALVVPPPAAAPGRPYLSYPDYADLRRGVAAFESLEAAVVSRLVFETGAGAERLRGETVTAGYFSTLGIAPQLGRLFTADEYAGRGDRAVLVSDRFWRTRLQARAGLIGSVIATRAGAMTLIGVLPAGFGGLAEDEGTDYWLAERQHNHPAMFDDRAEPTTLVFGRLARGAEFAVANDEIAARLAAIDGESPLAAAGVSPASGYRRIGTRVEPLAEKWRASLRPGLLALFGGALLLLAIGCANAAMLLGVRRVARRRELAIRQALGASRRDLARLHGVESMLLAACGGAFGVCLSIALQAVFERVGGVALPAHLPVEFGAVPLLLAGGLTIAAGIGFGIVPALFAARVDPADALARRETPTLRRLGNRLPAAARRPGAGHGVVAVQTALAVVLLAAAFLFLRSYERLRHVDFGFRTASLLRYQVSVDRARYGTDEGIAAFFAALDRDLAAIPGVVRVGSLAPTAPPYDAARAELRVAGGGSGDTIPVELRFADSRALSILDVEVLAGRSFDGRDRRGGAPVALVSRTLARRLVGDRAPLTAAIDRSVTGVFGSGPEQVVRVVGVLADARWNGQRNRAPSGLDVFLSLEQFPQTSVGLLLDAAVEPRALIDPVRRAVVARDPAAASHWIDTMDEALDFQTATERFWAVLAGAYGATALLLAVFGLHGVLSHGVARRTREIGVRLALGATRWAVSRAVVGPGLRAVAVGLAVGLGLASLAARAIASTLYATPPYDPLAYGGVVAGLGGAAAAVAFLAARRAARVTPLEALRSDG